MQYLQLSSSLHDGKPSKKSKIETSMATPKKAIKHPASVNRMSFQSQSPTRYDERGSTSKSSKFQATESPFAKSPNVPAHSEEYDSNYDSQICSKPFRLAKQPSSDIKTIKISKLIDFHKEIEQIRNSDILSQNWNAAIHSASKTDFLGLKHEAERESQDHKSEAFCDLKVNATKTERLVGDRFIPLRNQGCLDINEVMDIKVEIESSPPQNLLDEAKPEASTQNNQNNQGQPNSQNSEMSSEENLRKYNIMLQTQLLDIKNPHLVQNGFLNEDQSDLVRPCLNKTSVNYAQNGSTRSENHSLL